MRKQTINWQPFSEKHKKYIHNAMCNRMSVAEGSIRSGKTIDNCIIASMYLETCIDKIHLASGSSSGNAKINIGACNGFGLENLFRGRCKWGKYKGNECLYVYTKTGEKVVIFVGGGKRDSYKKILGNSYGLWIATEINEHYDSDNSRESFIKVAFGRQVASKKPLVLWDLNPCTPRHSIYSDYIDRYQEEFEGGYNYEHFTIMDNLSITPQRLKEIESQYDKNSVWYRRDILGERCFPEGLIYRMFADNYQHYWCEDVDNNEIIKINIGVDFGGSGSATTFVCVGFTKSMQYVIALESERHEEELDSERLSFLFANFCEMCYNRYGKVMTCYCDSAEQVLIRSLKNSIIKNKLRVVIHNAKKTPIMERIRLTVSMIAQDRFRLLKGHTNTLNYALCEAVWDKDHEDERLDDGTSDIDSLDAFEYAIEMEAKNLMEYRKWTS